MRRWWIPLAAFLGMTGVGMGAYASHGLGFISDPVVREATRTSLQIAVQQQMWHALALLGVGVLALKGRPIGGSALQAACFCWGWCCSVA